MKHGHANSATVCMLTSSPRWMQDDSAETSAKKARSEPAEPTSDQMRSEVSGTLLAVLGERHGEL